MDKIRRAKISDDWRSNLSGGEWKEISGWKGYFVNQNGQVKSLKINYNEHCHTKTTTEKMLSTFYNSSGYAVVNLSDGKRRKLAAIHRLVAEAFIPNPEGKPHINHIDGDKRNPSVDNLEWCTPSENEWHSYHVLGKKSNLPNKRKFTDEEEEAIRKEYARGTTQALLAERYGCHRMTVHNIIKKGAANRE